MALILVSPSVPGAQARTPPRLVLGTGAIALVDRASRDTLRYARPGDTVTVDVVMNWGRGEFLSGVQFYLRFDSALLEPLDAYPDSTGLQPVRSEGLIPGAAILVDEYNPDNPNRYRGIAYAEGTLSRRSTPDSGRVASVSFRMTGPIPAGGELRISIERDTTTFRSYYLIQSLPGTVLPLAPANDLHLTALPPVLSLPGSLTLLVDSTLVLNLDPLAADPLFPDSQLTWAVASRDSGWSAVVNGGARTLTLAPPRGFEGTAGLTLAVTNPGGFSSQGRIPLRVTPANRPPTISSRFPAEISVRDGSSDPLDLGLLVADPETPLSGLRWTFTGGRNTTAAVDPRYRLRITSARDWQGRESVTLAVADPEGASASVTFTVAGSVTPLPGDFDGNGRVDLEDFFSFAAVYGSQTGGPRYEVRFDMDRNGRIDLDDFFLFADGFGKVRGS